MILGYTFIVCFFIVEQKYNIYITLAFPKGNLKWEDITIKQRTMVFLS